MTYFYIITLQWQGARKMNIRTDDDMISAGAGETEMELFDRIFKSACAGFSAPIDRTVVLFYRLVPNVRPDTQGR